MLTLSYTKQGLQHHRGSTATKTLYIRLRNMKQMICYLVVVHPGLELGLWQVVGLDVRLHVLSTGNGPAGMHCACIRCTYFLLDISL